MTWTNERLAAEVQFWSAALFTLITLATSGILGAVSDGSIVPGLVWGLAFPPLWASFAYAFDGRARRAFERVFGEIGTPPCHSGWSE